MSVKNQGVIWLIKSYLVFTDPSAINIFPAIHPDSKTESRR